MYPQRALFWLCGMGTIVYCQHYLHGLLARDLSDYDVGLLVRHLSAAYEDLLVRDFFEHEQMLAQASSGHEDTEFMVRRDNDEVVDLTTTAVKTLADTHKIKLNIVKQDAKTGMTSVKMLGEGMMAVVVAATLPNGYPGAIKIGPMRDLKDEYDIIMKFQNNLNMIRVLDQGALPIQPHLAGGKSRYNMNAQKDYFIALEQCDMHLEQFLQQRNQENGLMDEDVRRFVIQLFSALEVMQKVGVEHNDYALGNIMVHHVKTPGSIQVKLIDFADAKTKEQSTNFGVETQSNLRAARGFAYWAYMGTTTSPPWKTFADIDATLNTAIKPVFQAFFQEGVTAEDIVTAVKKTKPQDWVRTRSRSRSPSPRRAS